MGKGAKRKRESEGEKREERPERVGPLRLMRVESGTQADYERVRRFDGEWLAEKRYAPTIPSEHDRRGEEYVTHVYDSGLPAYRACNLVAAMELHHPRSMGKWVLTGQAAAGFRKAKPVKHWPPMPAEVVLAAGAILWAWKRGEESLALMLGFHGYLRISDIVYLTRELVVLPGDAEGVRASVTIKDAKTGDNQTVFLDSEFVIALVRRQREKATGENFFEHLTEKSFREWTKKALTRLGLSEEGYVIHSLRHGGAARDYHHGFRSSAEVKDRGRWVSNRTFREYIDRGKMRLILDRLSGKERTAILEMVGQHHGRLWGLPDLNARFEHL